LFGIEVYKQMLDGISFKPLFYHYKKILIVETLSVLEGSKLLPRDGKGCSKIEGFRQKG
jgi:hypothetical protein